MAARAPRAGRCPAGAGPRAGAARPALTRTEILRQAKTAAVVQKEPRESAKPGRSACPGPRTSLAKVGPPPPDPKKVDFKRPGLTKAMQMRQKAAAEKIAKDAEIRRKLEEASRRPKRTTAPRGGDARMGCDRPPTAGRVGSGDAATRLQRAISKGHITTRRGGDPAMGALDEAVSLGHIVTDRRGAKPKKCRGEASKSDRKGPLATATPIPGDTQEFARAMDAQLLQAVPFRSGPVDKIIIEPGSISPDRNAVVCITRPPGDDDAGGIGASSLANRSIQVISETLDEQDAVESATVQGKLEELQNARREFVIAVANVGSNAVAIPEEDDLSVLDLDNVSNCFEDVGPPPRIHTPPRKIYNLPDVTHEMFRLNYGPDHPHLVAAREFAKKTQIAMDQQAAERRIEEGFAAVGRQELDDLRFDVPFEQDIMEGDVSWEQDEEGNIIPCESRIKASMPRIPVRNEACPREPPITIEELQRFMDLDKYPPTPTSARPPPGRENLHPDLWELEDPWYFEEKQPDGPDLMRFDCSF